MSNDIKSKRLLLFACAYGFQGLVKGFATVALSAQLLENGTSDTRVATLVALFFLPWSFKIIWGPIIDYLTNQGVRLPLLIGSVQIGATTLLTTLLLVTQPLESLTWVAGIIASSCVLISIQDVAVDSFAIKSVPEQQLGLINGGMQFGKYAGLAIGAAASAICLANLGFQLTVLGLMIALACLSAISIHSLRDRSWDECTAFRKQQTSAGLEPPSSDTSTNRFFSRPTLILCAFAIMASMGDSMLAFAAKPLYVKQFEWTACAFSLVCSLGFGLQAVTAIFTGRWIEKTCHPKMIMVVGLVTSGTFSIIVGGITTVSTTFPVVFLIISPLVSTIGWVGFLTIAMQKTNTQFSATQFAAIATICNIGTVVGVILAGKLFDRFHVAHSEIMMIGGATLITACCLYLLASRLSPGVQAKPPEPGNLSK